MTRGRAGVEEVAEQVRRIGAASGDDEAAHAMEDMLYRAVLAVVAQGSPDCQALAATALQSQRYHFSRDCG